MSRPPGGRAATRAHLAVAVEDRHERHRHAQQFSGELIEPGEQLLLRGIDEVERRDGREPCGIGQGIGRPARRVLVRVICGATASRQLRSLRPALSAPRPRSPRPRPPIVGLLPVNGARGAVRVWRPGSWAVLPVNGAGWAAHVWVAGMLGRVAGEWAGWAAPAFGCRDVGRVAVNRAGGAARVWWLGSWPFAGGWGRLGGPRLLPGMLGRVAVNSAGGAARVWWLGSWAVLPWMGPAGRPAFGCWGIVGRVAGGWGRLGGPRLGGWDVGRVAGDGAGWRPAFWWLIVAVLPVMGRLGGPRWVLDVGPCCRVNGPRCGPRWWLGCWAVLLVNGAGWVAHGSQS